ncbi:mechanosensitive ion channel family protein [Alteromonas sediminis]|uniref:Mechanosensitive ion channel family protein n=1 Tax=Alteromonas sediminis TaxID=2259342 RepID=A0A3N5Y3F6_9ALTE|nr:mechanosensitive ion channel family protein [Alteromonas sediminis]
MALFLDHKIVITVASVFSIFVVKTVLVKWVRSFAKSKGKDKRDFVNNIKNFLNFIILVVLLGLWAGELQNFALSIAAFSVAIVLATREFIQCVIGFFYLISTRPFRIGDWIQVENAVGEVAATDWIKSTLLEVDPHTYEYTGQTLFIPNNKLITLPIKNLNFHKRYVSHRFEIARDHSVNVHAFLDQLYDTALGYCEDFYDVAVRYNQMLERRLEVHIAGPEPLLEVKTNDIGGTVVTITIFCPTERAIELEQKITKAFMQMWYEKFAAQMTTQDKPIN